MKFSHPCKGSVLVHLPLYLLHPQYLFHCHRVGDNHHAFCLAALLIRVIPSKKGVATPLMHGVYKPLSKTFRSVKSGFGIATDLTSSTVMSGVIQVNVATLPLMLHVTLVEAFKFHASYGVCRLSLNLCIGVERGFYLFLHTTSPIAWRFIKEMKAWRGFTLMELLIVIAIVGLLSALLLGVLHSTRQRAYRNTCMNQLRQLGAGLLLYRDDYGELPKAQVLALPYIKQKQIYLCPSDPFAPLPGASFHGHYWATVYGHAMGISYSYVRERMYTEHFERLKSVDSNFGILVCALHDRCNWEGQQPPLVEATVSCLDRILRLRIDLSVQWVRVPMRWFTCQDDGAWTGTRDPWRLMSDEPCPVDICDDTDC